MNSPTLAERRTVAIARRRPPTRPQVRMIEADGEGDLGSNTVPHPTELRLETTYKDGRIVEWFDDNWWLEALGCWKDRPLTIHVLPTPDALLHPIVLHELDMVRRMSTPWQLIGQCYLSDIAHPLLLPRVAVNPYDEIRIVDATRPMTDVFDVRPPKLTFSEVSERVRAIQSEERAVRPLLTRAPMPRP